MEHLVYCDQKAKVLERLITKEKTMIVRGAAGRKLPYGRVFAGEVLYFVENDGQRLIRAKAIVKQVINSELLTVDESNKMLADYQEKLQLTPLQIKRWAGKKRLCLVEVEQVEVLEQPLVYERQNNMDDWISVLSIDTIIEGQSEKYHSVRI